MSKRNRGEWAYSFWRRIRRAWWGLQRFWWRLLEMWPFSHLVIFIRSLPLLILWLAVAFVLYWLLVRFISHFLPSSIETPDKEIIALLAAVVTALVGFGIQQWRTLAEREEQERQQEIECALRLVDETRALLGQNPSEAVRRYMALAERSDGAWKTHRVRSHLEAAWSTAPSELQHIVELAGHLQHKEEFYRVVRHLGVERSVKALEWAMEHLDDEWKQKAADGLLLLASDEKYRQHVSGQVLQEVEQRPWHAVLQVWPHLSFWRGFPPPTGPEIARGLAYLQLENNPFGSEKAETDSLLVSCAVIPPWLQDLHAPQFAVVSGASGAGKTATALLLIRDCLRERDAFSVYFPATLGDLRLESVARVLARTLLHYLAVTPTGFLECGIAGKAAIAHLLARYMRPNLPLHFHQAGLPRSGDGAQMLQEIETLIQGSLFHEPLVDWALLDMLGKARPHGFRYTMLVLDIQYAAADADLQPLLDLSDRLARVGVFTKAFLPDAFREFELGEQPSPTWTSLQWSDDDLSNLCKARLKQFNQETLAAWCNPEAKSLSPDHRLIRAAQGAPGNLIRKGNELLRRIGRAQRLLTADDLDEILGPIESGADEGKP